MWLAIALAWLVLFLIAVGGLLGALAYGIASLGIWLRTGDWLNWAIAEKLHWNSHTGWVGVDWLLNAALRGNLGLTLLLIGFACGGIAFAWLYIRNTKPLDLRGLPETPPWRPEPTAAELAEQSKRLAEEYDKLELPHL